ncbi:MAG: hypothetical protein HY611_10270 [Elusimicrobia bacterium]|nr:hypothetical protein [Elusimicrobiota bacterium]
MRSIPALVVGTEIVLFFVVFAYFAGLSAGYFVSGRLGTRGLRRLALAQWATHLTLPFSLRWIAGLFLRDNHYAAALIPALFLGSFWLCLFYSALLPLLLERSKEAPAPGNPPFARFYGAEVLGTLAGMAAIWFFPSLPAAALMLLYQCVFVLILHFLFGSRPILCAGLAFCGLYALFFNRLEAAGVLYLYRSRGYDLSRTIYCADTPYQRLEILEDQQGNRHIFLDGHRHYGTKTLSDFNFFIAGLPASLLEAPAAVIVGSGSFGAARQALRAGARHVVSVEIDPAVAAAGTRWLPGPPLPRDRWRLVLDDAKHFFGRRQETVDLIGMDIAGPFQRQLALLYTAEFYRLAKSRLTAGGLISVNLSGTFALQDPVSCRIVRTLLDVFGDIFVVEDEKSSGGFALAGDFTRFSKDDVRRVLDSAGYGGAAVWDRPEVERRYNACAGARPISLKHMDVYLKHRRRKLAAEER